MHMDFEDLQLGIQLALENWLYLRLEGIDLDRYIYVYNLTTNFERMAHDNGFFQMKLLLLEQD